LPKHAGSNFEPKIPAAISTAHARTLCAHFKTVEEYLRVVESSLEGCEGVFQAVKSEMPEPERVRIRSLSAEILDGLRLIKRELNLEPHETSSLGIMRAYLSELWVSLVETRGRNLRGYGEVPPELATYLDIRIDQLESRVNEIRRIIEDVARSRPGSGGVSGAPRPSRR